MPEQPFSVSGIQHRLLGQQIELQLARDFVLKFTPAEASSLSFALVAVRDGISPERDIYMSPVASDEAFVGTVLDHGMSTRCPPARLSWTGLRSDRWPNHLRQRSLIDLSIINYTKFVNYRHSGPSINSGQADLRSGRNPVRKQTPTTRDKS